MPGQLHRLKIRLSDPIRPSADELLTMEFAFISWADSCKVPQLTDLADFRECRRAKGHTGEHCSGFGANRVRW